MLNKVWSALLLIGLLYGFGRAVFQKPGALLEDVAAKLEKADEADEAERVRALASTRSAAMTEMGKQVTVSGIDAAKAAAALCLTLIGVMALWLGFMKVAEDAGMVALLSRALRPLLRFLFPDVPKEHPAGGAMIMNMAANILGLGNAATPLGLKAMKELQTLNPVKDTATNSMAMFLAINTSSVTLVPFSIIAYRIANGSSNPAQPVVPIILATTCSTAVAIIATRILQRFYPPPASAPADTAPPSKSTADASGGEVA